jgi:drug/metabolite transporter (DMT)-like permease
MIAAMMVFHESISLVQWLGIVLIMGGCYLVAR